MQLEKIELEDSRGKAVIDTLTVGRSLFVRLEHATPGATYRFALSDEDGHVVDEAIVEAGADSTLEKTRLFYKSGIETEDCPSGSTFPSSGGPGGFLGPFSSLSEASIALDGMVLWFTAEVEIADSTGGPGSWSQITIREITLLEPSEAQYYWSNEFGEEDCVAETGEPIYLSVYKGHLENFEYSRVFMITPDEAAKGDWNAWDGDPTTAPTFIEVRHRENCSGSDCFYENGSFETLPDTATIRMQGLLPRQGAFLAVIRPAAADGSTAHEGQRRYLCDRATEGILFIDSHGQMTEANEGWGCPPCPE